METTIAYRIVKSRVVIKRVTKRRGQWLIDIPLHIYGNNPNNIKKRAQEQCLMSYKLREHGVFYEGVDHNVHVFKFEDNSELRMYDDDYPSYKYRLIVASTIFNKLKIKDKKRLQRTIPVL